MGNLSKRRISVLGSGVVVAHFLCCAIEKLSSLGGVGRETLRAEISRARRAVARDLSPNTAGADLHCRENSVIKHT